MKKVLLLLLGGVLLMSTVTGCSNKKSKEEIESLFSDFMSVFQSDNYEFLYAKEADNSGLSTGDLGTWVISTTIYSKTTEIKSMSLHLFFNRNTKKSKGNFYIVEEKDGKSFETEYPVYYEDGSVNFSDVVADINVRECLSKFKMMFEILDMNDNYIKSLNNIDYFYNSEVPMYGTGYELEKSSEIIKKIEKYYPLLQIDKENVTLQFEGEGTPLGEGYSQSLYLYLDKNRSNYVVSSIYFSDSARHAEIFDRD